jgi:hypothetical protein
MTVFAGQTIRKPGCSMKWRLFQPRAYSMQSQQIRSLLQEAGQAGDPKLGTLYCHADLQDLLRKLTTATDTLLVENQRLAGRLRRSAGGPVRTELPSDRTDRGPTIYSRS